MSKTQDSSASQKKPKQTPTQAPGNLSDADLAGVSGGLNPQPLPPREPPRERT